MITVIWMSLLALTTHAAPKAHVVSFGKTMAVKLFIAPDEQKAVDIRVRGLYVDARLKEFTTGESHDVTEHVFVVQRAYRVNDSLPGERGVPRWKWQRGGWIAVDRRTGRVTQLKLPQFDPYYSAAVWYRNYVAYCGVSDSGEKLYAVVTQLGRKKAVVYKELGPLTGGDLPDSQCAPPQWDRQPSRVTFQPRSGPKLTFDIRGRPAESAAGDDGEE
jgi:hypothetical protein